jgi:steroid 3-oxidase
MQLKRRKTDMGETLQWTDYMSLSFTQHVTRSNCPQGSKVSVISGHGL